MNHPLPRDKNQAQENQQEAAEQRMTPSWFSQTYRDEEQEFIVDQYKRTQDQPLSAEQQNSEAYELYRRRMMDRLREQNESLGMRTTTTMPPLPARPVMPAEEVRAQNRYFGNDRNDKQRPVRKQKTTGSYIAAAGLVAVVAGGSIGFAITRHDDIANSASAFYQSVVGAPAKPAAPVVATIQQPSQETQISKKPISIATLKVADVTGSLNSMIPLALQADPAFSSQELSLQISGLPKSAYLNKGTRTSDTTWVLKDGEEAGLNLVVPTSDTSKFDVSVAAVETKTGELAAPVKEMTVALDDASLQITPANAPPETAAIKSANQTETISATTPVPEPEPAAAVKPALSAEVTGLLQKGDSLFKSGDLVIARQFYERAFQMGAADGAVGVARTYDPAVYTQMNVQGIAPDAAMATQWYDKAKAAGAVVDPASPSVASQP
jgi:hypothetical protein